MTRTTRRIIPALVALALSAMLMQAAAQEEHPFIREIPGFTLWQDSTFENFGAYKFLIETDEESEKKEVRGPFWELVYENKDKSRVWSPLEIIENYRQATLEKEGRILSMGDVTLDFTVPLPQGGTAWAHLWAQRDYYELTIVNEEAFKKRLTYTAREMKKKLDVEGRVAVYGVHFDFDKATLQPGAEEVLVEVVKLMRDNPGLKVEIQGHTDNVGSRNYNLDLSLRRAETVRRYLALHGVAEERMTVQGYGFDRPVASNATEEGRALNRRVELVRR